VVVTYLFLSGILNILLVDPGRFFLEKKTGVAKVYPHIGLAYVAASLLKENFNVRIVDMTAYGIDTSQLRGIMRTFKPDIVGITAVSFLVPDAYDVATVAKETRPETVVVLGGAHASALPIKVLVQCRALDIAVCGEGEYALVEIAHLLEKGNLLENLETIRGISYRKDGKVLLSKAREPIQNLDALPFPRWDLFDYSKYKKVYSEKFREEISLYQIAGSRGCPYQCTFCFPLHGRQFRFRSPENVVKEIEVNHEKLGAKHFDFTDSTTTVDRKRFMELCKLLMDYGLSDKVTWNFETRADLVDTELLETAKKAGSEMIFFGLESADPYVLSKMKKNTSPMIVDKAIREATRAGLKVKVAAILGHPFETEERAHRTFEFARKLKKKYGTLVAYNIIDIYPGTELYSMVSEGKGGARWIEGAKDSWASYDRTIPKIEVNDLTQDRLVQLYHEFETQLNQITCLDFYKSAKKVTP
jgi:anaerobic magnesium-protoporphyrin IX monomethyl ester cyclase